MKYATVELDSGALQEVTKDFLFPSEDKDLASLPTQVDDICNHAAQLDKDSLEALLHPHTEPSPPRILCLAFKARPHFIRIYASKGSFRLPASSISQIKG